MGLSNNLEVYPGAFRGWAMGEASEDQPGEKPVATAACNLEKQKGR